MSRILSVGEITSAIKQMLEDEFPFVWVRGQVTNLSRPQSGHLYFTLKDEAACLNVVWFRPRRRRESGVDPLTGEVLEPGPGMAASLANGQEILCGGRITVYEPRGQHQLVAELVQATGLGRLHLEFEALKRDIAARGWFSQDRKRLLPRRPERVAVVTAPTGAAIRDFLELASARGSGCAIRVYPALVQGDEAPAAIARAMALANEHAWAQVLVLIRGGGSLEDLWAFNTLQVAQAVHDSALPVLAGIGHEVDVSIADMVADVRAATPSHAAQLLWPERAALAQEVDALELALARAAEAWLAAREDRLRTLGRGLAWLSPAQRLERFEERRAALTARLEKAARDRLAQDASALDTAESRLGRVVQSLLDRTERRLELLAARLQGLDPARPLERGYALVTVRATGRLLREPGQVAPGDALDISLARGRVGALVTETETREEEA